MPDSLGTIPAYRINHLAWVILDFIYPPRCGGCGAAGTRWCQKCQDALVPIDHTRACQTCDQPLLPGQPCPDCTRNRPQFAALRSAFVYQGAIRKAIHRFKFQNDLGLAEIFGAFLAKAYQDAGWPIDGITSVPLSTGRHRERGYNQAQILARGLSWAVGVPFYPGLLTRDRETSSQVGLDADRRKDNVLGAFSCRSDSFAGKRVLVVDDIATTGATISACADALLRKDVKEVYSLTLARAVHLDTLQEAEGERSVEAEL